MISRKGKYKQTSKFANKKQNYKNILIPIKPIKVHVKPWTQVSNDLSWYKLLSRLIKNLPWKWTKNWYILLSRLIKTNIKNGPKIYTWGCNRGKTAKPVFMQIVKSMLSRETWWLCETQFINKIFDKELKKQVIKNKVKADFLSKKNIYMPQTKWPLC